MKTPLCIYFQKFWCCCKSVNIIQAAHHNFVCVNRKIKDGPLPQNKFSITLYRENILKLIPSLNCLIENLGGTFHGWSFIKCLLFALIGNPRWQPLRANILYRKIERKKNSQIIENRLNRNGTWIVNIWSLAIFKFCVDQKSNFANSTWHCLMLEYDLVHR